MKSSIPQCDRHTGQGTGMRRSLLSTLHPRATTAHPLTLRTRRRSSRGSAVLHLRMQVCSWLHSVLTQGSAGTQVPTRCSGPASLLIWIPQTTEMCLDLDTHRVYSPHHSLPPCSLRLPPQRPLLLRIISRAIAWSHPIGYQRAVLFYTFIPRFLTNHAAGL